jgi:hypothetical protein
MEKDLIKFNENITKITKEIAKYQDEKGNVALFNIGQLMCGCEYMELDEPMYKKASFEKIIDKDAEYSKIKITKVVDKSTKTHIKSDQGILIDDEVEASQVWVVKNGLGLTRSFNNKHDALKLVDELNTKYLEMAELKQL